MSEKMRESLSALLDGEANELEFERVLSRLANDAELRRAWVRYNLVRSVNAGQAVAHPSMDVSARVSRALADSNERQVAGDRGLPLRQRLMRPVASFAVAASVTLTVVIGGQQLAQLEADNGGGAGALASSASPVGMVNSLGASSVQASYGTRAIPVLQPATRTAYDELARQRLQKYMQAHAEHAALNSPNGLVPFARVPYIQE